MVDPLTALAVASSAVSQMQTLIKAGQDTTSTLSKFAGAWADINEAERRVKNPSFFQSFSGSLEKQAADVFACKKKAQKLKKDLETLIMFAHGPSGLEEYKTILRDLKKQKEEREYKASRRRQAILEWTVGIGLTAISLGFLAIILYYIGLNQGLWG